MAQVSWLYLDDNGGRHRVGLYHGDRSGHLVIYCNRSIMQIDFHVLSPQTYSFFIGDDLCEIHIRKEKNGFFSYEFNVNREVDTPKNRIRKLENRSNFRKTLLFFGGGIVLICLIFFSLQAYNRLLRERNLTQHGIASQLDEKSQNRLRAEGRTAVAKIFLAKENEQRLVFYTFKTIENEHVSGKSLLLDTQAVILPTGFELRDGDEFEVRYLPSNPKIHNLRYDQPTAEQVKIYRQSAIAAERAGHPEKSEAACICLTDLVVEEKGWQSLAEVVNQNTDPWRNTHFNKNSYQRLLRDVDFEKKLKEKCWEK